MLLESASITEFSIAVVSIIAGIAGCVHGSKCKTIKCNCRDGCVCERAVDEVQDTPPPSTPHQINRS